MPEAEELLVEAARHATVAVRDLWKRHRPPPAPQPAVLLADVRPRLELLVEAVLGRPLPIRTAQAGAPMPLVRRLFARDTVSAAPAGPLPGNDGNSIHLPPSLPVSAAATDDYSLLSLLQALRCERGSTTLLADTAGGLVLDLYLLAEAVACDFRLRRLLPGWGAALDGLHGRVSRNLANRRPRCGQEAEVAALHGAFLRGGRDGPPVLPAPEAALDWARTWARDCCRRHPKERYIPWLGDLVIGRLLSPEAGPSSGFQPRLPVPPPAPGRSTALSRRPRVRAAAEDEDDPSPGAWMVQTTEPQPHAEDPRGLSRPEDREPEADIEGAADSLAELEEARLIHTPSASRESFHSSDPPPRLEAAAPSAGAAAGIAYPEWDYQAGVYRQRAVRVVSAPAPEGPADWAAGVLARHAGLLREIRRRLGAIRPDRLILKAQAEGDDIDCDALVAERSERRAGIAPAGAFYQSRRPAPRRLGLLLLIDGSASTDAWVGGHVRVIDVEKEAALLAAAALDGARMDFAAFAFSGEGPLGVQVRGIKEFNHPWDNGCRCRIAGLEPDRYTRLGAALRHAGAILAGQAVDHRLLLLFSDGRPNDCDRYASRHGVEDARQALVEARLQHISPYCFTVDREGGSYLPAIFGGGRYSIVQHPRQLPLAFIGWLQQAARHCR